MDKPLHLIPHPDTPPRQVRGLCVNIAQTVEGALRLTYIVDAPAISLRLDMRDGGHRTDGLWQTTCFELFVKRHGYSDYIEYNLASSGDWAAYVFDGYRAGMAEVDVLPPSYVAWDTSRNRLTATIALPAEYVNAANLRLNPTVVIEEADGTKSYWALAHPGGAPDFHHDHCFQIKWRAAGGA